MSPSEKRPFSLRETEVVAEMIKSMILPYFDRFLVVGSTGRKEPSVGDLDLLAKVQGPKDVDKIRGKLAKVGDIKKDGDRYIGVSNVFNSSLWLDFYFCHPPAQWGVLVACRMNPAELVIWGKKRIDHKGYTRKNGAIFFDDREIRVPEESDWFGLVDLPYVKPSERRELMKERGLGND